MSQPTQQVARPQTGIALVDRYLARIADLLNGLLRSAPLAAGSRQVLGPFTWSTAILAAPQDVPHTLQSTPLSVSLAQVTDNGAPTTPITTAQSVQWGLTPNVKDSIRVYAVPGLTSGHTYTVYLLAHA